MHLPVSLFVILVFVVASSEAPAQEAKPKKSKAEARFAWVNPLPQSANPRLVHRTFDSKLAAAKVGYNILLPHAYETSSERYSVVYHLHGGRPGSENKAIGIAGQLIDATEAEGLDELIHVFVNGGPVSHYNVPDQPGTVGADVFIQELIPHIDANYRTHATRVGRALTGFSQGGRATMRLSLRYPELFVCAAAGGGGYETEKKISESDGFENPKLRFADGDNTWDLARAYATSDQPRVQYLVYVGTEGFNYQNNLAYMEFMNSLGIDHQSLIVEGVPHSNTKIYDQKATELVRFFNQHLQ